MTAFLIPLFALLGLQSILSLATFALPVFAPDAAADLGIRIEHIGYVTGLIYAGTMAAGLMSGTIIGRLGAVRAMQAMLAIAAIGIAAVTLGGLAALAVGAVLIGFAYGPNTPASSAVLARYTPPHWRNFAFSVKQAGMPLGSVFAGLVVPLLVAPFGWKVAVLAIAAACLAAALAAEAMRRRWDAGKAEGPPPPLALREVFGNVRFTLAEPALRRLTFAGMAFISMQFALSTFFVSYLYSGIGIAFETAGIVYAVAHVAGVLCRPAFGIVADRWVGPTRLLGVLGLVMAAAGVAITQIGPTTPLPVVTALGLLLGGTASGWNGVMIAEVSRLAGKNVAGIVGAHVFTSFAAVVVSPMLFSALLTASGSYPLAYGAVSALAGIAGASLLLSGRRRG